MNVVAGDTTGRDRLRDYLRAPATVTDLELQHLWDATVGACEGWIKPEYTTNAPEQTIQFVLAVANHVWQASIDAGGVNTLADGTSFSPYAITGSMIPRYLPLGGRTVRTRVVAGGSNPS